MVILRCACINFLTYNAGHSLVQDIQEGNFLESSRAKGSNGRRNEDNSCVSIFIPTTIIFGHHVILQSTRRSSATDINACAKFGFQERNRRQQQ